MKKEFNKEIKILGKDQIEIPEMKSSISQKPHLKAEQIDWI
jgi:hypothetical protein